MQVHARGLLTISDLCVQLVCHVLHKVHTPFQPMSLCRRHGSIDLTEEVKSKERTSGVAVYNQILARSDRSTDSRQGRTQESKRSC